MRNNGQLCAYTYQNVQTVYKEVERKEGWCNNAVPIVEAAILSTEDYGDLIPTFGGTFPSSSTSVPLLTLSYSYCNFG